MNLVHKQDYFSIKKFDNINLPAFSIITGLNGAGKSQLLMGIKAGSILVENIPLTEILYFDSRNFALDNEQEIMPTTIPGEKTFIINGIRSQLANVGIHPSQVARIDFKVITDLALKVQIPFYLLSKDHFDKNGLTDMFAAYEQYRIQTHSQALNIHGGSEPNITRTGILRLLKTIYKPITQLTLEDLDDNYIPISHKDEFLINKIGKLFWDYHQKWDQNLYNNFKNEKQGESNIVLSAAEFIKKHGEKPWVILNNILARFGSLHYRVNSPEGLSRDRNFILKLISTNDHSIEINFESLSSGEKIMMALASSILKVNLDNLFPKVLLLDEIDSGLHPSMAKSLLDVIEKELVEAKKMEVMMITHSPSTIALAPEESLFLMSKYGKPLISKTTKKDALKILTEGFASLTNVESNLQISYNISKSSNFVLLTEGITDRIILESARMSLEEHTLPFDLQDCFDASFLRNLMSRGEIFDNYPEKTFVALFDFDFEGFNCWDYFGNWDVVEPDPRKGLLKKHKKSKAYVMLLPAPNSGIGTQVIKGGNETYQNQSRMPIELLFAYVGSVRDYFADEVMIGGGTTKKFKGGKVKFAEIVKSTFVEADYINLVPLFDTLKVIYRTQTSLDRT